MSKKPTTRKHHQPTETPAAAMTIADYAEARNVDRGDVAAAIETVLEGHSTHPSAELTAAEQATLDDFFEHGQAATSKPSDQDEQPEAEPGLAPQPEQHPPEAPPMGAAVTLPPDVTPYGPRQEGQHCWLVEFLGPTPAVAYAWGLDETEAISRSLTALRRPAGKSRYRVRRCQTDAA